MHLIALSSFWGELYWAGLSEIQNERPTYPASVGYDEAAASDVTYLESSNGSYYVNYIMNLSDGSRVKESRYFIQEGNEWKLIGNGKHASVSVYPKSILAVDYAGSAQVFSGMYFELRDHGNYGLQTAVATGPGLPPD